MFTADLIAWLATLCVGGSYLFQIKKAYESKHLDDVSWLFLFVITLGNLLWVYYGYLRNDFTFFVANIVIASFVFLLMLMKLHYRKR
jgi:uncharacterized protein with PQ loop repeat